MRRGHWQGLLDRREFLRIAAGATALGGASSALFEPRVARASWAITLYLTPPGNTPTAIAIAFEKATGIKTTHLRLSAGEIIHRVRAERNRPQADALGEIGLSSLLTLKQEGLLEPYRSPHAEAIPAKYRDPDGYWTAMAIDFIGFASNRQFLKEKGLKAPASWEDLTGPLLKGQVAVGNPSTSGTGYTFITTVLQVMGESKGWEYLHRFNANVAQYTRSGIGPRELVGRGEAGVGILFAHDILSTIEQGFPVEMSVPAEGTGYDLFCVVILKGAPNLQEAKKYVDWSVTPEYSELLPTTGYILLPTHPRAKLHDLMRPYANVRLINNDFAWVAKERTRILEKFQGDILAGRK